MSSAGIRNLVTETTTRLLMLTDGRASLPFNTMDVKRNIEEMGKVEKSTTKSQIM